MKPVKGNAQHAVEGQSRCTVPPVMQRKKKACDETEATRSEHCAVGLALGLAWSLVQLWRAEHLASVPPAHPAFR